MCNTPHCVLEYSDIGISTGAYAALPLAAALLRIAELAPSAEICSWGLHSLLQPYNTRAVSTIGLPFTVHGPLVHDGIGSRSRAKHRAAIELHRRHMSAAAELGATVYVVHPDLQPRQMPWNPRVAAALERSFDELRLLQEELRLTVVVENLPFARRSHYTAPGDLDLQGLGLALDVGHATVTGTLAAWLADSRVPIRHLHLHDNLGRAAGDLHQALGSGVVDAAPALTAARAAGASIVLEHIREADVIASLEHLRRRGLLPLRVR